MTNNDISPHLCVDVNAQPMRISRHTSGIQQLVQWMYLLQISHLQDDYYHHTGASGFQYLFHFVPTISNCYNKSSSLMQDFLPYL